MRVSRSGADPRHPFQLTETAIIVPVVHLVMRPTDTGVDAVSGALLNRHVNVVKKKMGTDGLQRFFDEVNKDRPRSKMIDSSSINEKEWYPFQLLLDFYDAESEVLVGDPKTKRRKLEHEIAQDLGVLKFFVKWVGSPAMLAEKAHERWRLLHKYGQLDVDNMGDTSGTLVLRDYFIDERFCYSMEGFLEGLIGVTKKDVKVHQTKCTAKGDDVCEFVLEWKN